MAYTTYSSENTPLTIPVSGEPDLEDSIIISGESGTIGDLLVQVQITPPDSDPQTLIVAFERDSSLVVLHDSQADSLADVTYDTERGVADFGASLSDFDDLAVNSTYKLYIFNYSSSTGTLNDWNVQIEPIPPEVLSIPLIPNAPVAISLPGNIKYGSNGKGRSIPRKNIVSSFNIIGAVSASSIIDKVQLVPFDAFVDNVSIVVKNSGSASTTTLSLHKVTDGVDTTIINQILLIKPGYNYIVIKYSNKNYTREVQTNDTLYFSVDSAGDLVSDLHCKLTLNERIF